MSIATAMTKPDSGAAPAAIGQPAPPASPVQKAVEKGKLPPGFSLTIYGSVELPTSLAFGPDGLLYVASNSGHIYRLSMDANTQAAKAEIYASGFETPLGLLWSGKGLYVSSKGEVTRLEDADSDGLAETRDAILTGLPNGRHQNAGMAASADGWIYMGLGSTCDACREADDRSGTIVRFHPDGRDLQVFARGLRAVYDLGFDPISGELFATDNGRDDLGDRQPADELNWIQQGAHYGWPLCWGYGQGPNCDGRRLPIGGFPARSSPDGLVFYSEDLFPAEYRGNLFVARYGSYVDPGLAEVDRVQLLPQKGDYFGQITPFLTGVGRPLDVTIGPNGDLYVADYQDGQIYRITYRPPEN